MNTYYTAIFFLISYTFFDFLQNIWNNFGNVSNKRSGSKFEDGSFKIYKQIQFYGLYKILVEIINGCFHMLLKFWIQHTDFLSKLFKIVFWWNLKMPLRVKLKWTEWLFQTQQTQARSTSKTRTFWTWLNLISAWHKQEILDL
jgi:hypothetical protein